MSADDADGNLVTATGVQIPGVLDDLYANDARLGPTFSGGVPTLRVWAPTAHSVRVRLYDSSTAAAYDTVPMTRDDATGVWSVVGTPAWKGRYYLYEVEVWQPATMKVETNLVTDPYSLSLSTNSQRSQIVDLADPALAPAGWSSLVKPPLAAPEDIVLYELHIRDFSANDMTVPAGLRGTYKAFTVASSNGMRHLKSLASAGLDARPSAPGVRLRHHRRGQVELAAAAVQLVELPARLRESAVVRDVGRGERRVQLGLRPVALHRARGQLCDESGGRARATSSSDRWSRR